MRWWPRTVRWQLILWLMLLEVLSVGLFAVMLVKVEGEEIHRRALERLAHQATSVALQAEEAYRQQHPELVFPSLRMMGEAPSVARAKITDAAGNVLFVSSGEAVQSRLEPGEKAQIAQVIKHEPNVFAFGDKRIGGVLLMSAGLYQLTPLKTACLEKCRSPLSFLMRLWRPGLLGAARLGLTHGLYCLGCCAMLMALLFVFGVMNLAWVACLAVVVLIEKVVPQGQRIGWLAGVAVLAIGVAMVLGP